MTSRNEKGFTLIEMSIVLVLIGLIIGGILKGQEMINSTRLKMTVTQWDGIKAAWNAFEDKYNGIPGDFDRATTLIRGDDMYDGDGNNQIDIATEAPDAWDQLQASNFMSGVEYDGGGSPVGGRVRAKVRGAEFILATDVAGATDGWRNDNLHYMFLVASTSDAAPVAIDGLSAALTGEQAFEIDRKYDDEQPDGGSVRFSCGGTDGAITSDTDALSTTPECMMMFSVAD
ncbi:MAG: prepilin-type N-terminal cleavage/methylation domain-containing protein [Alphaproteobacteria bacterium]|nr:prepilin-type N-terminal cleavage/methylation domain-containing protein [Alphaproteobacteria bacterium]